MFAVKIADLCRALAAMKPEDLFPVWCWIDRLQERGEIPLEDALQWKVAIYGLMEFWELEPDYVVPPLLDSGDAASLVHRRPK